MTDQKLNEIHGNTWTRPELIILMRSHPEETVLENDCKHPGLFGPGDPNNPIASCANNDGQGQCQASNNKS